ncbi:MAG: DUF4358 domain-containing protein [Oscillospiraceae bacterium]|jgi:hypothetical protein|nr:DUF4358 domain-containing protein [Oscillospiraceae bacterium]
MKKTYVLLAMIILLTACEPSTKTGSDSKPEQSSAKSSDVESGDVSGGEDTASESGDISGGEDTASESGDEDFPSPFPEYDPESRTYKLYEAVAAGVEFPVFMQPVMEDMLPVYIGDPSNVNEYCVYANAISVGVTEVIIAEAKDDKIDEVEQAVMKRLADIKENAAFYPGEVGEAAAALAGKKGNIVYMICHIDAVKAQQILLENIPS